jgi:hypothetical protein
MVAAKERFMKTKILIFALIAGAVVWELAPRPAVVEGGGPPLKGPGFVGVDQPLSSAEQEILGAARPLKRLYQFGDSGVIMLSVPGDAQPHAIHDPSYCLTGDGWKVIGEDSIDIPGGQGRLMRVQKDDRESEFVYWFSDGERRHSSFRRFWLERMRTHLLRQNTPMRMVMLQPAHDKSLDWNALLAHFPHVLCESE